MISPVKFNTLSSSQQLELMGVETWITRDLKTRLSIANTPDSTTHDPASLGQRISTCQRCQLHQTRTQVVIGVGNQQADLMLVGEAPGYHEDQQGEPFVGKAGQLLTHMLAAIGLSRQEVFIANILKCRPPNNRDPSSDEVAQCTPFLLEQIHTIKPRLLVALGRVAAHFLLANEMPLSRMRQQIFHYHAANVPLIVTYHPAYLLRNPLDKRKAWQDWQLLQEQLSSKNTHRMEN